MFRQTLLATLTLCAASYAFAANEAAATPAPPSETDRFIERFKRIGKFGDKAQTALVRDHPDLALGAFRSRTRTGESGGLADQFARAWEQAFASNLLIESERIRAANLKSVQPLLLELLEIERQIEARSMTPQDARNLLDKLKRIESKLRKLGESFHAEDAGQLVFLLSMPVEKQKSDVLIEWKSPMASTPQQQVTRFILESGLAIRTLKSKEARTAWWKAFELQAQQPSVVTLQRMEELRDFVGEIVSESGPSSTELMETQFAISRKLLTRGQGQMAARYARQAQQLARHQYGDLSRQSTIAMILLSKATSQSGDARSALALASLAESNAIELKDSELQSQAKSAVADVLFAKQRYQQASESYAAASKFTKNKSEQQRLLLNQAKAAFQVGDLKLSKAVLSELTTNVEFEADRALLNEFITAIETGTNPERVVENKALLQTLVDARRYDLLEALRVP